MIEQDGTMEVLNREEAMTDLAAEIMIFKEIMHVMGPSIPKHLEMTTIIQKATTLAINMSMIIYLATKISSVREEKIVTAPTGMNNNDFEISADTRIEIIQPHQETQGTTMNTLEGETLTDRMIATIHSSKDRTIDLMTSEEGIHTIIHRRIPSRKIP